MNNDITHLQNADVCFSSAFHAIYFDVSLRHPFHPHTPLHRLARESKTEVVSFLENSILCQ